MRGSRENIFYATALIAVLLLTVGLRLYGIDWGLPSDAHPGYSYHPDERYTLLWARWLVHGEVISKHFIYGGTLYYTILNSYIFFGNLLQGALDGANLLADSILVGRYFHVIVAVLTVSLLFECGRLLFERSVGLIAAALLALSPAHVMYAQLVRPDEIGVLLVVLSIYLSARVNAGIDPPKRALYSIGLLAGVMLAYRFPLIVFVSLPAWAMYFRLRRDQSVSAALRRGVAMALVAGAIAFVTYVVFSPHTVLYFRDALAGLAVTYQYESDIFLDAYRNGPLAYQQLAVALPQAFGYGAFGLGLIGVVYAVRRRTPVDIMLLSAVLLYGLLMANASWVVARYALPMLPLLALLGARVVADSWHVARPAVRVGATMALIAALAWSSAATIAFLRNESSPNVRDAAAQWMERNVPAGSSVMMAQSYDGDDFFNPVLSDRFKINYLLLNQHNDSATILHGRRFDYVVLHEIVYASLDRLGKQYPYPQPREFYRVLNEEYSVQQELKLPIQFAGIDFSGAFTVNDYILINPGIRIYRRVR
jgi:hypothetical protein